MAQPIALHSITQREAVADALYRAVIGLDTNDHALFESAWHTEDACFDRDGTPLNGMEAINKYLFETVKLLDSHHMISNVRVDLQDGANVAYMTAYAVAEHYRGGDAKDPTKKGLLGGTMYFIDVVKDGKDDLWKMKNWKMKICWIEGDVSVVS